MGITFPIATPRRRSSKFPWKGTSQVTYVTMVPWIGNETLRPLGCEPCFGCKLQTKKRMMCPPGVPFIAVAPVVTSWAVAGQQVVFLYCMLQTRVTLKAFPIATNRGRNVSFPIQGTMFTYVTWDVLFTGLPKKTIRQLQLIQKAAAKIRTRTRKSEHITPVLRSVHWLPVTF